MNQNQDPNILQNVGDFAMDAAVDTTADNLINQGLDTVEAHVPIPGGQMVDKMINTEVDQVVNKGVGGMMSDVEGLFGHKSE